ncbi:MAG: HAD-IIB family hydrolase [Clostridia bacterium]|nr:HAD-IIB family hydrolase [Clostridia bacterium]
MIKLAVSDFDGTLLPYTESSLSSDTISAIEELLDRGVSFAISSGRNYSELISFLPQFADKIFFTCCDGALTVKNGNVIYARKIETSDTEMFFRHKKEGFSFVLHGAFENYYYGDIPAQARGFNALAVGNIFDIKDRIFKITTFGDKINLPEYCGIRSHWEEDSNIIQYVNRFSNKGTALSDLHMKLMLTKYDTAVLGDRGNDVCMAKSAKISCCIGNRCDELASVCTHKFDCGYDALKYLISIV